MRVISGKARGIALKAPDGIDTRPTTDRVKENIFNMIQHEITDRRVLDLFSGSGALAIEAISRGASEAVLVESNKKCCGIIADNLMKTRLTEHVRIIRAEVPQALKLLGTENACFELLLMDPPYGQNWAVPILEQVQANQLLAPSALVIVEHEAETDLPERIGSLGRINRRTYGRTAISIYREGVANESSVSRQL